MLATRKVPYHPTEDERKKNLTYTYSCRNQKVQKHYDYRFVRTCDFPYDTFLGKNVKEHKLLVPKYSFRGNHARATRLEVHSIEEEYAEKGYFIIRNPKNKQSVPGVFHKHILKIAD